MTAELTADPSPTRDAYISLDAAFRHFDERLFCGSLSGSVLLSLQRRAKSRGFFSSDRFIARGGSQTSVHEIALNPATFAAATDEEILAQLVHDMVHAELCALGRGGRRGYHNRSWAERMCEIGLRPTADGRPDGRRTGERVTQIVVADGPFDKACRDLLCEERRVLRFQDNIDAPAERLKKMKASTHADFVCPTCDQRVRGKKDTFILCGNCRAVMRPACEATIHPDDRPSVVG